MPNTYRLVFDSSIKQRWIYIGQMGLVQRKERGFSNVKLGEEAL